MYLADIIMYCLSAFWLIIVPQLTYWAQTDVWPVGLARFLAENNPPEACQYMRLVRFVIVKIANVLAAFVFL